MNLVIAVDLYWLPLGAGGSSVRLNGKVFEFIAAAAQRRERRDLFHSALIVTIDDETWTIELCPEAKGDHGRVAEGIVGSRILGGLRLFRYEARCWLGGSIPDIAEAVASPVTVSRDRDVAMRVLEHAPAIPTPVWGRDELGVGEMWNSNSVIAWLLERAGVNTDGIELPPNGRAPGWHAGVVVARR
ncbi:MAG: hypothetical protein JHC98_02285 [Thermoleophilaceae bacterium]|nr:hypothetical protein [Thermoleophilaceae bacterium]